MKRMKHALHGFTHAINEHEEQQLINNGWVEDVVQSTIINAPVNNLIAPARGRGRPHKVQE